MYINIFCLRTKFGDCRFSRSVGMIAGIEIENGSCSWPRPLYGLLLACHLKA